MEKVKVFYENELKNISLGRNVVEEFIEKFENGIDLRFSQMKDKCLKHEDEIIGEMKHSFLELFEQINQRYQELDIRYIYISFLRTAFLNKTAMYRIDFYDQADRLSAMECAVYWDCKEISDVFYSILDELKDIFKRQSKLKGYVLEERIVELAEEVCSFTKPFIEKAILQLLEENANLWNREMPAFFIGEYMDKIEKVESMLSKTQSVGSEQ